MAISRRQLAGAAFTPSGTAIANLPTPTADGATLVLAVMLRGQATNSVTITPDPTYGEWTLAGQETNGTNGSVLQLWVSRPKSGCPGGKVTLAGGSKNVGCITVLEYSGCASIRFDRTGANQGTASPVTESVSLGTRVDGELWVTAVGSVPQSNSPISVTGGSSQVFNQASTVDASFGNNIEMLEKSEPTAGGTFAYSSGQVVSNAWSILTAALIPGQFVDATATNLGSADNTATANKYKFVLPVNPGSADNTATPTLYRDISPINPGAPAATAIPKVARRATASGVASLGIGQATALVTQPTLRLDSLISNVLDGAPGSPIVLVGLFPVGENLTVKVGGKVCLSGVSGRPVICQTVRADQLLAYLPDMLPGKYDVLVSSSDSDSQLDKGVTIQAAQNATSIFALRQTWSTKWKVGDRS